MSDEEKPTRRESIVERLTKVGGAGVGSAMAGLDGAAFRNVPPPIEIFEEHRHRGPVSTGDAKVVIVLPDEVRNPPK